MAEAIVLGGTGMVGTQILANLRTCMPAVSKIHTITRRPLPSPPPSSSSTTTTTSSSLVPIASFVSTDNTTWSSHVTSLSSPCPSILFSALATTRAAAGSFAAQHALEHDLNVSLARAAKTAGVKVYVLVSGHGASSASRIPYTRMKGEIEDHIREIGFEHTVIVRPGLIAGRREEGDTRLAEAVFRGIAGGLGRVSERYLKDWWAQEKEVIARAAVGAGLTALRGELEGVQHGEKPGQGKVTILSQADIVRLGRDEWVGGAVKA